jgi:DNA-binding IclR family transcriptional regulator
MGEDIVSDEGWMGVKSADRTLSVLELLSSSNSPRSLGDIANELDIPKSSLHSLLRNMHNREWLATQETDSGLRYRIGPRALTVGASYFLSDDIVQRSSGVLDSLSLELGETLHLGILEHADIMYLAKRDARHALRLVSGIGVRLPAYATALGKSLLAELNPEALSDRMSQPRHYLTTRTLVDESKLREDLRATQERGFAIDLEESTEGIHCFAVSIGPSTPRRHAISCSVPIARLDDKFAQRVIQSLVDARNAFSESDRLRTILG